jgi:uncharacterized membrane protein (DUF441 family)
MNSLCSPALLFLILAIISVIMGIVSRAEPITLVVKALFIVVWTWFLNFLCSLGHEGISWFLVIMPFIIMLVVISTAYAMNASFQHSMIKSAMMNMNEVNPLPETDYTH